MTGYKNEWIETFCCLAPFIFSLFLSFLCFFILKMSNELPSNNTNLPISFTSSCEPIDLSAEIIAEIIPGDIVKCGVQGCKNTEKLKDTGNWLKYICEKCILLNPEKEFCTGCKRYEETNGEHLCGRCQHEIESGILKQGLTKSGKRCSRMIRRNNKKVRCLHTSSLNSEFCFVHKHIAESEKTLEKIKAFKKEQHIFNASEYEWKTCEECLAFLKKLNIKDAEKFVPRATCKNCKLFFRMVEHPVFGV